VWFIEGYDARFAKNSSVQPYSALFSSSWGGRFGSSRGAVAVLQASPFLARRATPVWTARVMRSPRHETGTGLRDHPLPVGEKERAAQQTTLHPNAQDATHIGASGASRSLR
jgi:hypothetical protein